MRRCGNMPGLFALFCLMFLGGCATKVGFQDPAARAQALGTFRAGQASLQCPSGVSCAFGWGYSRGAAQRLMQAQRWEDLADVTLAAGYDEDLPWFYLGLAAAGLNLNDAARTYFDRSIQRTLIGGVQSCLPNLCDGINLPADAQRMLASLPVAAPARRPRRVFRTPARQTAPSEPQAPAEPAGGWVAPVPTKP